MMLSSNNSAATDNTPNGLEPADQPAARDDAPADGGGADSAAVKKLAKRLAKMSGGQKAAPDAATTEFAARLVAKQNEKETASDDAPKPAPPSVSGVKSTRQRWLLLAASLAMIVPSWYFIWKQFHTPSITFEFAANRPMLKTTPGEYRADDIGLRFTPPPKWSMQMSSNEDPEQPLAERIVVKYKRIVDKAPAAWYRVTVVMMKGDELIVESVRNRSPGKGWKINGQVEAMTVGGLAAAKAQYNGDYNGARSIRDIIGVRRGDRLFIFQLTYQIPDRAAQEEARQSLQTVLLEDR